MIRLLDSGNGFSTPPEPFLILPIVFCDSSRRPSVSEFYHMVMNLSLFSTMDSVVTTIRSIVFDIIGLGFTHIKLYAKRGEGA